MVCIYQVDRSGFKEYKKVTTYIEKFLKNEYNNFRKLKSVVSFIGS